MSKDTGIGCIATIAIIALIVIGFVFFREKLLATSAVIVILAAPFLPLYYLYRKHEGEERIAAEYEKRRMVEECVESLEEVEELVEGSIEGFKGFGWYIKDCEKEGNEKELKSYEEDIKKGYEGAEEFLEWYKEWYKNMLKDKLGIASEYGSEIRCLYTVLRKTRSITDSLRGISVEDDSLF